jgi:transposase-like protein
MVLEPVLYPARQGSTGAKHGTSKEGNQRYKGRNSAPSRRTFIRQYSYRRYFPQVKQQIADMAVNGRGIRDTARVLSSSPTTVMAEFKKVSTLDASSSSRASASNPTGIDCSCDSTR